MRRPGAPETRRCGTTCAGEFEYAAYMWRRAIIGIVLVACSNKDKASSSGSSSPRSSASGTASSPSPRGTGIPDAVAVLQQKLDNACSLLPAATVAKLVPDGGKPEGVKFPLRCAVYGKQAALEIAFDTGPKESGTGPESVDGLGESAAIERLNPKDKGDVYLTIVLGTDKNGTNHNLHVEVSGHDGKEHKDDAIGLAREVIAQLH